MTAGIIIGVIIGIILFLIIGYYLWSYSIDTYDYNIFNIGIIIRGLLSFGGLFGWYLMVNDNDNTSANYFLIATGLLWLWNFIATLRKTNVFIAILSLIYLLFAVFIIKYAINKILED